MLTHILECLPEEACGLLAGRNETVEAVLPVTNRLHSQVRYLMEPVELLQRLRWLDEHDMQLLSIYHSHPQGPNQPSAADLAESNYPDSAQVIWFPASGGWDLRGFTIVGDVAREIPLTWQPDP